MFFFSRDNKVDISEVVHNMLEERNFEYEYQPSGVLKKYQFAVNCKCGSCALGITVDDASNRACVYITESITLKSDDDNQKILELTNAANCSHILCRILYYKDRKELLFTSCSYIIPVSAKRDLSEIIATTISFYEIWYPKYLSL